MDFHYCQVSTVINCDWMREIFYHRFVLSRDAYINSNAVRKYSVFNNRLDVYSFNICTVAENIKVLHKMLFT